MRKLIGLIIIFLFLGCDTLLQDRDVSPRLTLIPYELNDNEFIFYFEMYAIEQINSFACEILFDSEIFDTYTEGFADLNDNGGCEYNEEYFDCGLDQCCDPYEDGNEGCLYPETNPDYIAGDDLNGDNYNLDDPYNMVNVENNGVWDDNTIIYESAFAAIPHFAPISKTEYGKLSILGALVELEEGLPLVFEAIDSRIATIHLKIKQGKV